ncbi:MAG: hypothetical protein JNL83_37445 [Myxococcales bacterium]|nr:hypothetical protein [Myxococcales bacterium]
MCLSLLGCKFAVQHPAATIGIVGGSVGLLTCEIGTGFDVTDGPTQGTCAAIAAGAGLALAGIVALAIYFGGDGHTVLVEEPIEPIVRDKKPPAPEPAVPPPSVPVASAPGPGEIALPAEPWYRDQPERYRVCVEAAATPPSPHFPAPFDRCDTRSESYTQPPGGNSLHFHYKDFSVAETTAERAKNLNACCYLVFEFPRNPPAGTP